MLQWRMTQFPSLDDLKCLIFHMCRINHFSIVQDSKLPDTKFFYTIEQKLFISLWKFIAALKTIFPTLEFNGFPKLWKCNMLLNVNVNVRKYQNVHLFFLNKKNLLNLSVIYMHMIKPKKAVTNQIPVFDLSFYIASILFPPFHVSRYL